MGRYLGWGALAGALGGLASAVVLLAVGEGPISGAIALEEAGGGGSDALFSRREQLVGGALGVVFVGTAMGAVFSAAFAGLRHRLPGTTDAARAVGLAAVAFVTIALVPFLKYPANPPAVGDPDTIGRRTALYLVMIALSVAAVFVAARLWDALRARGVEAWPAATAATVTWVILVVAVYVLLPGNPDPVEAPAQLVWRFRVASLGGSLTLWVVTGLVFGWLCRRGASAAPGAAPSETTFGRA